MKNTKIKYEEKESDSKESFSESYSDKESSSSKNKNSSNSNENNLDNNNNNEILNITTQYEEILEFETTPIETISIKKFRNLLGIIGVKAANFIVERLYQILIRISSKKYELIRVMSQKMILLIFVKICVKQFANLHKKMKIFIMTRLLIFLKIYYNLIKKIKLKMP